MWVRSHNTFNNQINTWFSGQYINLNPNGYYKFSKEDEGNWIRVKRAEIQIHNMN